MLRSAVAVIVAAAVAAAMAGCSTPGTGSATAGAAAPPGTVARAPSRLVLSSTLAEDQANPWGGEPVTVSGRLLIEPTSSGGRTGVQAVDLATRQVRWRYLRANDGRIPKVSVSPQAVVISYPDLPAVFLDAATGKPEPLTHTPAMALLPAVRALLGTTYVQITEHAANAASTHRSATIQIAAISAVTGQLLWSERVGSCPYAGLGISNALVQAGQVIALAYQCVTLPADTPGADSGNGVTHLALFAPGGKQRDLTLADAGNVSVGGSGNVYSDVRAAAVGGTVLVSTPAGTIPRQTEAVDATTGALVWKRSPGTFALSPTAGQVILGSGGAPQAAPPACDRYAADSGRELAAYPASTCGLLLLDPVAAVSRNRLYLLKYQGLTPGVITVDASSGRVLATTKVRTGSVMIAPFTPTVAIAAGTYLVFAGGNAEENVLAIR